MAHHSTVFSQLLKWLPRHRFETLADKHHKGGGFRKTSRWSQFVMMGLAQLSGRVSLRDVVSNAMAQARHWFHLGARPVTRSTLARLNQQQPWQMYEELFGWLYQRFQAFAPAHGFRFKNPLYSLDSTLIELSLKLFPWSHYALSKGALKLHVKLSHQGLLPAFATITDSHTSDIAAARLMHFAPGSVVVFDRGYTDYEWYKYLTQAGIYFVTRLKSNACYRVVQRRKVPGGCGLISDQIIELTGKNFPRHSLPALRRVVYQDPKSDKRYEFLTNHFEFDALTVAQIYEQRWQIELFFKWIKQNLKIRAFLGNSLNAVKTQIWIALCMVLLLAFLKYLSRVNASMQQILRLLQLNLFAKRDLFALLRGDPDPPDPPTPNYCLNLA